MFSGCTGLESVVAISTWKTSAVTNMFFMFSGCRNLASLNVSGWNTSKVVLPTAPKIPTLVVGPSTNIEPKPPEILATDLNMFGGCVKLEEVTLGRNFYASTFISELPGDGWTYKPDPSYVYTPGGLEAAMYGKTAPEGTYVRKIEKYSGGFGLGIYNLWDN